MSSQFHSAKVIFFDVGETDFEHTPVYRLGFKSVMSKLKNQDTPLTSCFITYQGKSDQSGKAFLYIYMETSFCI